MKRRMVLHFNTTDLKSHKTTLNKLPMELKVTHGYVREERWIYCRCESNVHETLFWYWHLKDNKQRVSEDTRLHLVTESWNHSLWSPICVLPLCVSYFFPILYPSISPLPNQSPGRTSLFHSVKKRDYNICRLHPLSPSSSFHFSLFFPLRGFKGRFFAVYATIITYRCNYTKCFIFNLGYSLVLSSNRERFWNIHAILL